MVFFPKTYRFFMVKTRNLWHFHRIFPNISFSRYFAEKSLAIYNFLMYIKGTYI